MVTVTVAAFVGLVWPTVPTATLFGAAVLAVGPGFAAGALFAKRPEVEGIVFGFAPFWSLPGGRWWPWRPSYTAGL